MTNEQSNPETDYEFDPEYAAAPTPNAADLADETHGTDESEYTDEDYAEDEELPIPRSAYAFDNGLDIDAALAAISTLPDLLAEPTLDAAVTEFTATDTQIQPLVPDMPREEAPRFMTGDFQTPTFTRMQRGSLASVIPALLLIVVGAYLTFALTLSSTPPAPAVVMLLVCGVIGLTLLAHWLQSGRWARGAFFIGMSLILTGVVLYGLTMLSLVAQSQGLPLLMAVFGVTLLLSGWLARPRSGRFAAMGLGVLVASAGVWAINQGLLTNAAVDLIRSAWVVVLPALVLFMLLALIFRRQPAQPA